ncbi:hypothetical protein ACLMJK_000580 [Lecanora helva]
MVVTSYEDVSKPLVIGKKVGYKQYRRVESSYRPGLFHRRRTDTALLRTCRAVYRETCLLPVSENIHRLGMRADSRFPLTHCHIQRSFSDYFLAMTPDQVEAIRELHIFPAPAPQHFLSRSRLFNMSFLPKLGFPRGSQARLQGLFQILRHLCPETITITFCHSRFRNVQDGSLDRDRLFPESDWKTWESKFERLKTLKMELEVPKAERGALQPLIDNFFDLKFAVGFRTELVADRETRDSVWTGLRCQHSDGPSLTADLVDSEEAEYSVTTLIWRPTPITQE